MSEVTQSTLLDTLNPIERIGQPLIDMVGYRFDENQTAVRQIKNLGFDPEGVKAKGSLGLISMHERIHSVNGTIMMTSTIGAGTKIEARIPTQS